LVIQQIETSQIVEDTDQPRKHHSEESLQGLADSIRQHGMLNPITVTPLHNVNKYKIVTGERRWRAAGMVHLDTIPCIVKEVAADERLTEQLIENLQREDLQPLEKARAIHHVKTTLTLTNRELARRLGLSERTVGYLLDLLALPEDIGEAVVSSPNRPADGQLTEKHARFLKQLNEEPELQTAVVDKIREDRLSSDDTGQLVKALKKHPEKSREILDSPTDHLVRFFQDDADPAAEFLNGIDIADTPARLSPVAQRIIEFLPHLSGIDPNKLPHPELRQIEDALTSLKLAVDGLLRHCKEQLGEKV
jgi:ParB family transcriptional regulator, chromosome partitioning protein